MAARSFAMLTSLKTLTREERSASVMRYGMIALFALIGIGLNLALIAETLPRILSAAGVPAP